MPTGGSRPTTPPRSRRCSRAIRKPPRAWPRSARRTRSSRKRSIRGWRNRSPQRLLTAATPPASRSRSQWWRPASAIAATLVAGIALGWFGREALLVSQGTPTTFAREAAFSHAIYARDQGRPVEVGARTRRASSAGSRAGSAWKSPRPTSRDVGFTLVGGRLVAGNEKPMALLMYENADKQRLTLQWRKNDPKASETAFRYAVENDVGVFYWIDENCAYALSGDVDRARLLAVANIVHAQLVAAYAQHLQR